MTPRKKRFGDYADVPEVRGTKDEFGMLTRAGWRIDSNFMWTRRWRRIDPPHFVVDNGVGVNDKQASLGERPSSWYFRTAGAAFRFEQGKLRGLGSFDIKRLALWQSKMLRVWYAVVVDRVMGNILRGTDDGTMHVFNVALVGNKGSRRFKIKPNGREVTVPIDVQPVKATVDGPTRIDPHPGEDHKFLRGFIQGYRQAMEFAMQQIDENAVNIVASKGAVAGEFYIPAEEPAQAAKKAPKRPMAKPKPGKPRKTRRKKNENGA